MNGLTLVMAARDEGDEVRLTCESALESPGCPIEIVVVDDASVVPVPFLPGVRQVRVGRPLGLFAAKRMAVAMASAPAIVLSDAHVRFRPGWAAALVDAVSAKPDGVHVAYCVGPFHRPGDGPLESWEPDLSAVWGRSPYRGANLVVRRDPQPAKGESKAKPLKIMEGVWQSRRLDGAVPCPMGSVYGLSREWWIRTDMLAGMWGWGGQEPYMALATWLAGGEVLLLPSVTVCHMFHSAAPYPPNHAAVWLNKMLLAAAFPPPDIAAKLLAELAAAHAPAFAGFDMHAATRVRRRFDIVRRPGSWEFLRERFPEIVYEEGGRS